MIKNLNLSLNLKKDFLKFLMIVKCINLYLETISQFYTRHLNSSTTTSNTTSGPAFDVDGSAFVTAFIKFVTFSSGTLVALFEGSARSCII